MTNQDAEISGEQNRAVAAAIREELARRRISRQHLADLARLSLSTLEKALSGSRPFTLATLVRLEEALGRRLRPDEGAEPPPRADTALAPDELGSYARAAVGWIIGDYLTLRPSFGDPQAIYAYRTDIFWDDATTCLAFQEAGRLDASFTQFGLVAIPHQSGHIYLVTNRHGQYRLIVLSRPTNDGEMFGVLTSLKAGRGSNLTPVSTPIALVPLARFEEAPQFGRVAPADSGYAQYRALLDRVTADEYAVFAGAPA